MRSIFLISSLLFYTLSFAQSTGYMGKRFLLGYGFNTSPSVFNANGKNETIIGGNGTAESGNIAFNAIHEAQLEFAASSKWMVCFSARYYKTVYDNANLVYSSNVNYSLLSQKPTGYYNIRGLTYTLYFKYFGSRYVAPWGRYIMFGPTINTVKTTYDPNVMYVKARKYSSSYNDKDTTLSNFGSKEQDFTGINLMFGAGRSRIIANHVVIDYGFNIHVISVISSFFDVVVRDSNLFWGTNITEATYIESKVKQRVRGVNRFNVFLKIGVLLF
jgi:hypothetical protein